MEKKSKKGIDPARDPDVVNSEAALRRAAKRARDEARRSMGYVVVYRINGSKPFTRVLLRAKNSMKRFCIIVLMFLCYFPLSLTADSVGLNDPESILNAIEQRGARPVIRELWETRVWQEKLFPGVSSADPKWLRVAKVLRPHTDAGASSELSEALSIALQKAPYRVIPVLKEVYKDDTFNICSYDHDSEVPGGAADYVAKLEKALLRQASPTVAAMKAECLKGIRETRERLKRGPPPEPDLGYPK